MIPRFAQNPTVNTAEITWLSQDHDG